jgi:hypothetical protein
MKIDIKQIIKDSGEVLSFSKLADEMADEGIYKNHKSAYDMLRYHQSGKAQGCDYKLVIYLCKRFNRKVENIIQW